MRRGKTTTPAEQIIVVCNLTPVVRHNYGIGVPQAGCYRELLNSDANVYGGSGVGNLGAINTQAINTHGRDYTLSLTLPPLATLVLQRADSD